MIDFIRDNSVVVIVVATAINLFFVAKGYWLNKKKSDSEAAVIDINMTNLPPYTGDCDKRTVVSLKNVGTAKSEPGLLVLVNCSWTPGVSYKLNFPTESTKFGINEEFSWKLHLPGNPPEGSNISVEVKAKDSADFIFQEQV